MKNPFSPDAFSPDQLKRIPRDLSHRKVFTTEFGRGTPVLCQEVFPGDTIKLDNVELKIQGMPTYFPLTSELKVSVSYFYCRNRCVDEDWEDFIFNTKQIDKAWLRLNSTRAKKMISTGSLGDFLGLPSTYAVDSPIYGFLSLSDPAMFGKGRNSGQTSKEGFMTYMTGLFTGASIIPEGTGVNDCYFFGQYTDVFSKNLFDSNNIVFLSDYSAQILQIFTDPSYYVIITDDSLKPLTLPIEVSLLSNLPYSSEHYRLTLTLSDDLSFDLKSTVDTLLESHPNLRIMVASIGAKPGTYDAGTSFNTFGGLVINGSYPFLYTSSQGGAINSNLDSFRFVSVSDGILDATDDLVINLNKFVGNDPDIKVESHAFRHYTMIGNYFYRNDRNNPYVLNGEVQYNKFIPSKASGPDDNEYDFFYRNWELDRFTSCCQTPQFGDAPLVGLTYNGVLGDAAVLTFQATDELGNTHDYTVKVGVGEDYKLNSIADFDKDIPSTILQNVTNMISYGTSINDIRVTNSFQRFLERAQRGLRYRHQMKSHLGVSVDYPDIDIPQYVGGFNGSINSFRNENTAASEYANLGDFNGSLYGNFGLKNPITVKVPEHGYIMGIMTITPVPMYPQAVTNKALIKRSPFEYPLQEFLKVGNVPVTYAEVMPLQNAPGQSPDDVFGYQRPFYEYLSNLDEVHGDFRTTLTQFNCVRMFAERPELSADFTTVHPEALNQIFITNNIADKYGSNAKFMCLINYRMSALRQIPDGDPALE